MMEVRPYKDGDIDLIKGLREPPIFHVVGDWAFTVFKDEEPIASFGCYDMWAGVGHIWMANGEMSRGNGLALTRSAIFMLRETIDLGYHRIQTFVDSESNENKRWIELLGLKYEGTMVKGSADGKNLDIYGMVI